MSVEVAVAATSSLEVMSASEEPAASTSQQTPKAITAMSEKHTKAALRLGDASPVIGMSIASL